MGRVHPIFPKGMIAVYREKSGSSWEIGQLRTRSRDLNGAASVGSRDTQRTKSADLTVHGAADSAEALPDGTPSSCVDQSNEASVRGRHGRPCQHMQERDQDSTTLQLELQHVAPPGSIAPGRGVTPIRLVSLEVISIIMALLGPWSMLNFSLTCKSYNSAFKHHMLSITYQSINKFEIPPERFMKLMLSTSSIIAGSVPANILSGNNFLPSDLDVISPSSQEDSMRSIFTDVLGFVEDGSTVPHCLQDTARAVHSYKKNEKSVRLWIAAGENPTVPVMLTTSTFVMNFISPWGIYCAYPRLTLLKRAIINHFTDDGPNSRSDLAYAKVGLTFDKYTSRGVAFAVDDRGWTDTCKSHRCYVSPTCTHTTRNLYDPWGMHIPFPVTYEGIPPYVAQNTRYDARHTTIWSLGGDYCNDPVLYHRAFAQDRGLHARKPVGYDEDEGSSEEDAEGDYEMVGEE
ncbi:hypothetical protein B0H16DRAFT_1477640 [Mycena metata]|uniref:F-box domain-containing protein n=1 Tax=Mycena metata TaxID=1033252 RepID=A0AAD7MFD3_9AGAR|nr:hypothetical protein B0H16DRAFT_1477640 [Mycena metata]